MRSGGWPGRLVAAALALGAPATAQTLERPPNLGGVWTAAPGVVHFHVLHRFEVLDPPARKVLNTPTFRIATGLAESVMVGGHYATSSRLVAGRPNEWEVFGRWVPVRASWAGVDGGVRVGWNGTAESVDGEVALARSMGSLRLHVAGRGFTAWQGGESAAAAAVGAVWRLHRWVALAGDYSRLSESGADPGWSVGLQLGIPYTPHTLSLHVTNVNAVTLQSASVGDPDRRLWGFEFTVPITLSRYLGGREGSSSSRAAPVAAPGRAPADTVRVTMDNRLRFLPDTVRIPVGGVVEWTNTSDIVHTVTGDPERALDASRVRLPAGAAAFDSGDLLPGDRYVHRFTVSGEYRYVCLPHEAAGMIGVVIVGDGEPGTSGIM